MLTGKPYTSIIQSMSIRIETISNTSLPILRAGGYRLIEDVREYENHGDVSLYFPGFFVGSMRDILSSES